MKLQRFDSRLMICKPPGESATAESRTTLCMKQDGDDRAPAASSWRVLV
jgi:hypothetical protein